VDRSASRAHEARLVHRALPERRVLRARKGRRAARDPKGLPVRSVQSALEARLEPTAR